MDTLDVLYDHYKETFSLSKESQGRRNKSFVILCVLEAISFLLLIRPEMAFELILKGINRDIETPLQLSNTIIQTLIWLLIVYVMIRYIQDIYNIGKELLEMLSSENSIDVKRESINNFRRIMEVSFEHPMMREVYMRKKDDYILIM